MTSKAPVDPDNKPELAPEHTTACHRDVEDVRQQRLAQIPRKQRSVFLKAWKGKSRKAAIRAFCFECAGYESAEVNRCTAPACPLYEFREDRL